MTSKQSSHNFVRSLKAPSDPPVVGGPHKIEIAREAWEDVSFYVPSKAELIVEWMLNKLLKERKYELSDNPVTDLRYWMLLLDILLSDDPSRSVISSRPLNTWLAALLLHIPIGPILISFLCMISKTGDETRQQLSSTVSQCFNILWPLSAQKINTETLLDYWGTVLDICIRWRDEGVVQLCLMVSTTFQSSLRNSSNRKKLHSTFIQNYLVKWLKFCADTQSSASDKAFHEITFKIGIDTLFNLDTLRPAQDVKPEMPLIDTLLKASKSSEDVILKILPELAASYIRALRRHRGALFIQSSKKVGSGPSDELRVTGMRFCTACLKLLDSIGDKSQTWTTRAALLSLVDQENLFHQDQVESSLVLNRNLELSLEALSQSHDVMRVETAIEAVKCLSAIARIDYDLVIPSLPSALPLLLPTLTPDKSIFAFLELLLEFHQKTRTMQSYTSELLASLSTPHLSSIPGDAQEVYQRCLSGPLFHSTHLELLSKSFLNYLTPRQTLPTATVIIETIKRTWKECQNTERQRDADDGERPRKRKKTASELPSRSATNPEILAISFALFANVAAVLLSSLPMASLTLDVQEELKSLLIDFRDTFLRHCLSKVIKNMRKSDRARMWSKQIVGTSMLRLHYSLDVSRRLALPANEDKKLPDKMRDVLDVELLPELSIEIFRHLFYRAPKTSPSSSQSAINRAIQYLETSFEDSDVSWSGQLHKLTSDRQGKTKSALALLQMILGRWLSEVEYLAAEDQLKKLIRIIMSIKIEGKIGTTTSGEFSPSDLLLQTLHSGHFWELHNIRAVFLAYLVEITSPFDKSFSNKFRSQDVIAGIEAYRLILHVPIEYFSKTSRATLIKRALSADFLMSSQDDDKDDTFAFKYETWVVLRVFLRRMFAHSGGIEQQTKEEIARFLGHLLEEVRGVDIPLSLEFTTATVDLITVYYSELLKLSKGSSSDGLVKVLASYSQYQILGETLTIRTRSLLCMVELLSTEFALTQFSDEIMMALRHIYGHIASSLQPQLIALVTKTVSARTLSESNHLLLVWCCLLSLGRWLKKNNIAAFLGRRLTTRIIQLSTETPSGTEADFDAVWVSSLAVLLQELHYLNGVQRLAHLELVVAAYITLTQIANSECCKHLDEKLSKACGGFSPEEFGHVLQLVSDSLTGASGLSDQFTQLVRLSVVLFREHPQNVLKQMQMFFTQCINEFTGNDIFIYGSVQLRLQVLDLISQHCSERPAALRPQDLGSIWSLLSKFMAPSRTHDKHTTFGIFHKIISVMGSLVRLRRDLVIPMLPQLGMVLRQLLLSIRRCRPQLGVKQTTLVMDTQPGWMASTEPLRAEEGKALSRLLETLNTKTIVRSYATMEVQRTESLSKPFSMHAAYVLKAYIEATNDPLCVVPLEMRQELQPGLFALCNMMSEYSRDAMMVSALDGGGKATLKSVWKEYDRQRYIGKG